ncbi:MAG: hypothetical protein AAGB00_12470 [Planctomycetota bacterium]
MALAIAFTVLLNVLILATYAWPEWLPERVKLACGLSTGAIWLIALVETRNELRRQAARRAAEDETTPGEASRPGSDPKNERLDDLLVYAQRLYLAGDWVESERALRRLLRLDRDDIEGQLLLVSVLRLSGQQAAARQRADRLARRHDAAGWRFEIEDERQRIEGLRSAAPSNQLAGGAVAMPTAEQTDNGVKNDHNDNHPPGNRPLSADETVPRRWDRAA